MTSDLESTRSRAEVESRPDGGTQQLSRRELRLKAEQEKVAAIAREREIERIREVANKRAEEIRREKEAARAREADNERFQEQINISQQIPTLPKDALLFPPALSPAVAPEPEESGNNTVDTVDESVDEVTGPTYAERGHLAAAKRQKADAKAAKRSAVRSSRRRGTSAPSTHPHRIRNGLGRVFVVSVVSGLLAVLALPATGFNTSNSGWAAETATTDQSAEVTSATSEAEQIALGEYAVTSYSDLLKLTYGVSQGFRYSVTNAGKIRWPFPVVVPISSGFGGRVAPCLGCSSYHEGLDFNPHEGTPFYSVADGEVTEVHDDAWGLGKWVVIHHETGKYTFDSLYAHMLRDSTGVKVGQKVKVGDYIGRVGNSGTSTGAHLHFEIHLDGKPVDPFDWMKKHTK